MLATAADANPHFFRTLHHRGEAKNMWCTTNSIHITQTLGKLRLECPVLRLGRPMALLDLHVLTNYDDGVRTHGLRLSPLLYL